MGDSKSIAGEVEGDYGTVKVQLAGGPAADKPARPTKGTQLVWGGTGPSTPWGHLAALIEKGGGSVNYTFIHASDLKAPLALVKDDEAQPPGEDAPAEHKEAAGAAPKESTPIRGVPCCWER